MFIKSITNLFSLVNNNYYNLECNLLFLIENVFVIPFTCYNYSSDLYEEEDMRQWTATHLAKLARKASIAAGKKVQIYLDKLPAKWIKIY